MKTPVPVEVVLRTAPVSACVAVTVAPGRPPPVESTTVPVIEPVELCAKMAVVKDARIKHARTAADRTRESVFMEGSLIFGMKPI